MPFGLLAQEQQDSLPIVQSIYDNDTLVKYRSDGTIKVIKITPLVSRRNVFTVYHFNRNEELTKCKSHYFINDRIGSCGELFMKELCKFSRGKIIYEKYNTHVSQNSSTYRCYFELNPPSNASNRLNTSKKLIELLTKPKLH